MDNVEWFFRLAVSKARDKMLAGGWSRAHIAEFLTRPGHLSALMDSARELHFQMFEALEERSAIEGQGRA